MFDTMFPRNPFSYFADEFEELGPWTNWDYNRTPPRQQHRERSAHPDEIFRRNYRKRQPTWNTPFWEIPSQDEEEMPTENPVEENYHTAQRKGGNKCRHKSGCPKSHPKTRVIRDNDFKESACSNQGEIRQDLHRATEDFSSGLPINEREREENLPEEKEIQEEENDSKDKLEESKTVEQGSTGEEIDENEEKIETEVKEKRTEEQTNEDENPEDKVEKQEENIEEKLKLIDEQLKKARELVPKEVLMSPRTDKQRLYLTEMLLRCILDLDSIETRGNETVKQRRKEVVREIQSYLDIVENES